jgi:hypothetical protein
MCQRNVVPLSWPMNCMRQRRQVEICRSLSLVGKG